MNSRKLSTMATLAVTAVLCAACAGTYLVPSYAKVEELIASEELQSIDKITVLQPIRVSYVNDHFGLLEARNDQYLVRFPRVCRKLQAHSVFRLQPLETRGSLTLRAPFDKINNCDVSQFFLLDDDAKLHLQELRGD